MDRTTAIPLRIGDWHVDPRSGQISREGTVVRVEARTLRLLLCLAEHAGEVVSIDELLDQVWSGVVVTQDSVYQAVASLRRLLGDDPKQPAYIATVPRLGYRLVASVRPEIPGVELPAGDGRPGGDSPNGAHARGDADAPGGYGGPVGSVAAVGAAGRVVGEAPAAIPTAGSTVPRRRSFRLALAAAVVVGLALGAAFLLTGRPAQKSIAVLPFLDLTSQEMNEEYFADGMTEELIDRLSKVPGLRVKQATAPADAKLLGVAYVLDGSVRKSGDMLRITARLVRGVDGYVAWSETYDRPPGDKLRVQDDIAGEVAKALRVAIN